MLCFVALGCVNGLVTRLHSCRYIFTMLSSLARLIFPSSDDSQLSYLHEDNVRIEPEWYCPIIPMVLVNGAEGIGTGYSTFVPNFNVREIVANITRLMNDLEPLEMVRGSGCGIVWWALYRVLVGG